MAFAIEQQVVEDPTARHVLLVLANYANADGRSAFPSVDTLAIDTGLSARIVQTKLKKLKELGAIAIGSAAVPLAHIGRKDRLPVCYDILIQRGESRSPRGTGDVGHGVNKTSSRGEPRSPNPSINHKDPPTPASPARGSAQDSKLTLKAARALWAERGEKALGEGDRVFRMRVPTELLELQWAHFKQVHADETEKRTLTGWRIAFRSTVKANVYGLWVRHADGSASPTERALALLNPTKEEVLHAS
jgi:hypothetical protein